MATPWVLSWSGAIGSPTQGEQPLDSEVQLTHVLATVGANEPMEFILGRNECDYPQLVLSSCEAGWYVHHFPDGEDPGAHVVGQDPSADAEVHLPAGAGIYVMASQLVSRQLAHEVAVEYLRTGQRPDTVEWSEF